MIRFFLPGRLDGLNTVIDRNRANRYAGASQKREITHALSWLIHAENIPPLHGPYGYKFIWHEQNRRRDPDNIASAVKFVFDALQLAGIILAPGWEKSKGCIAELLIFEQEHLEVLYYDDLVRGDT